jgi:phosphoribosylaminoimidazole (AIR) synthetase
MAETLDYKKELHVPKDKISDFADLVCSATVQNREEAVIIKTSGGKLTVVSPKKDNNIMLLSCSGNHELSNPEEYAASMVTNMVRNADILDMDMVGFANVIDYNKFDEDLGKRIYDAVTKEANKHKKVNMNGENAGLGSIITKGFNISGTAIGYTDLEPGVYTTDDGLKYAVFNPEGKFVFLNSDGVGTKMLIHQRTGRLENSIDDFFAMVADDALRKGAIIKYIAGMVESKTDLSSAIWRKLIERADMHALRGEFSYLLQKDIVGDRLSGYSFNPVNVGGTAVSVIDTEILNNMPRPMPGDAILAIVQENNLNPRSNGISKLRLGFEAMYGKEWHNALVDGMKVGDFAGAPSVVYYPVFRDMLLSGQITGFYHMSGGSHNKKFAKPFAKLGLYADLDGIHVPHPLMIKLFEHLESKEGMTLEDAFDIFPMGNDCYITTNSPKQMISRLYTKWGLVAKQVGVVQSADAAGKTGINLTSWRGAPVYYNGKD